MVEAVDCSMLYNIKTTQRPDLSSSLSWNKREKLHTDAIIPDKV